MGVGIKVVDPPPDSWSFKRKVLIGMVILTLIVTLVAYFMLQGPGKAPDVAFFFSAVLLLWLFVLTLVFVDNEKDAPFFILNILFGAAVGLVIGALLSPWGEQDKGFSDLTKALGSLITGYVAAKIDPLVKKVLDPDFVLIEKRVFLIVTFLIALAAGGVATYSARVYQLPPNKPSAPPANSNS